MSSEVKRRQNSGNIECLRPGGGASKKQCHPHGRNEFADWGEYCGRLGGSCTHKISLTVI